MPGNRGGSQRIYDSTSSDSEENDDYRVSRSFAASLKDNSAQSLRLKMLGASSREEQSGESETSKHLAGMPRSHGHLHTKNKCKDGHRSDRSSSSIIDSSAKLSSESKKRREVLRCTSREGKYEHGRLKTSDSLSVQTDSDRRSRGDEKRSKKRQRSQSHSTSTFESFDSEERRNRRRRKEKKRRQKTAALSSVKWGKYGVIQEQHFFSKRPELQQWLLEVKGISTEGLPLWLQKLNQYLQQEKQYFRDFMEEYNTATLPHKKFYDLEKWEKKLLSRNSKRLAPPMESFDDERLRRAEIEMQRAIRKQEEESSMLREIREDRDKVNAMRHQQRLQTQMRTFFQMGRVEEAQKIRDRLKPDDQVVATESAAENLEFDED